MIKNRGIFLVFCTIMMAMLSGCGGGGGSPAEPDDGMGSGNAIQDLLDTFSSVRVVLRNPLVTAFAAPSTISQHVHCSESGQASVLGTISGESAEGTFSLSGDFSYASCDGLNSTGTFAGSFSVSGSERNFTGTFGGTVGGNGCSVSLGGASYAFPLSSDPDTIAPPSSGTASGTLSATCAESAGSATVSCDWGAGVDVTNSTAMTAGCSCTGSGCG